MATLTLRLSVRVAWWFPIYKFCLLAKTRLTRREPDMVKVARWCERAIKVSVI